MSPRSPIAHRASAARVERSRYKGGKDSRAASGRATPSPSGSGWASVFPRWSEWSHRIQPGSFVGEGTTFCGAEATATPAPRYGSGPPPKWPDRPLYAQG
ncbi:hypothetical protein NDU88_006191 [Pleurodeles waltl]|uniref:Uncharacterized protein n=1 Tax=Pleurodeles waltl TaxID=8319 RepID=A0AAV7MZP9_PLEWA|nr:hypothetical protein NDU88_006191 [Pleurodeles waltl]